MNSVARDKLDSLMSAQGLDWASARTEYVTECANYELGHVSDSDYEALFAAHAARFLQDFLSMPRRMQADLLYGFLARRVGE